MITTILTFATGLLSSLLPEVLKLVNKKSDQKHEIVMFELQLKYADAQHRFKIEEINTQADVKAEEIALESSKPEMVGYTGKSWLDGVIGVLNGLNAFINGTLRPFITYGLVGLYAWVKYGTYKMYLVAGYSPERALTGIWTDNDMALMSGVIGHWFGSRMVKWSFERFAKRP